MRPLTCLLTILPGLAMSVSGAAAENPDVTINVGDAAPEFEVVDHEGHAWKSVEHVGKKIVVVYFYPADMTGGCTKQACGFRDKHAELEEAGVEVVGVSGDSVENHQLFRQVYDLNFSLLADEEGKVARLFGVPIREGGSVVRTVDGVEKTLTRGVSASRWTFVIGLDGKVIFRNTDVKAEEDSQRVLEAIENATGGGE